MKVWNLTKYSERVLKKELRKNKEKEKKQEQEREINKKETSAEKEETIKEDEFKDKYFRLLADFENYKRRNNEEKEKFKKQAVRRLIEELIPVLDNFNIAANLLDEEDKSTKGILMIYQNMEDTLLNNGLSVIKDIDVEFDPNIHHAILIEESEDFDSGKVIEIIQCGYILNGKLIKPALVKVAY